MKVREAKDLFGSSRFVSSQPFITNVRSRRFVVVVAAICLSFSSVEANN